MSFNQKNIYGFRKTKAYGLCALALGSVMFLQPDTASAAELTNAEVVATAVPETTNPQVVAPETTESPATNYVSAQPEATPAANTNQEQAETVDGALTVAVDNQAVEAAAQEAKAAGVEVTETAPVAQTAANTEEVAVAQQAIAEDQAKQVSDLKTATDQKKDQTAANAAVLDKYNTAKATVDAQNAAIDKENALIDAQNAETEVINAQRIEENKQIKAENARLEAEYNAKMAQYTKDMAQYQADLKAFQEGSTDYQAALAAYNTAKAAYDVEKANYDTKLSEYNKAKTKYDADLAAYNASDNAIKKALEAGKNNTVQAKTETASNTWTNLSTRGKTAPGTDYAVNAVGVGTVKSQEDLTNGNYKVVVDIVKPENLDRVIEKIYWNSKENPPKGAGIIKGDTIGGYDVSNDAGYFSMDWGTTVILPKAVTMHNGEVRDLQLTLDQTNATKNQTKIWSHDGTINYYGFGPALEIKATYHVMKKDGSGIEASPLLWVGSSADIDVGQTWESGFVPVLGVGGGLSQPYSYQIKSNQMLGNTFGKNRDAWGAALQNYDSTPDGTVTWFTWSHEFSKTLSNNPNTGSAGVADGDFGVHVLTELISEPQLPPAPPTPPEEPKPPTDDSVPPTPPVEPVLTVIRYKTPLDPIPRLERVPEPEKPITDNTPIRATYHGYSLVTQPDNLKGVTNEDGQNINNQLVPKASDVRWVLTNESLSSGRDYIDRYMLTDPLPTGFEMDEVATALGSPAYYVSYDQGKHTVVFTATEATLQAFNRNFADPVAVPIAQIAGRVHNDEAIYRNNFTTTIELTNRLVENGISKRGDTASTVTVHSNVVQVETPGSENPIDPTKVNKDEKGVVINGRPVVAGSDNFYTLTWDLDQYKGMTTTRESLQKGFHFVDDYPEAAVVPNATRVSITDSKGQAVSGIAVKAYQSVQELSEALQKVLKEANIAPTGAFQLFSATDPQSFFTNYVKAGNSLTLITPMTVKKELAHVGGTYNNKAYQVDFGNGYATEVTTNNIPVPKPDKDNYNTDGVLINGELVLAESVNNYKLKWDFSQFKSASATDQLVSKGFYFVDDYPEEAVTINTNDVKVTLNGQAVANLTISQYASLTAAPEAIQAMVKETGIKLTGAFQVIAANDPQAFFKTYVQSGSVLDILDPMTVKKEFHNKAITYVNKGYQVQIGQGFETKPVENRTPTDSKVVKTDFNPDGVLINGLPYLAGETNHYTVRWDLTPYKDLVATR